MSFAYWGGIEAVTEGWPLSRPEKPVVEEEAAASCVIPWYRRFGSKKTSPPSPVDPELLVIRDRMQRKRDAFSKAIAAEKYLSPCMQREAFARPDMPPVLVLAGSAELLMSDAVAAYVNSIPAVEEKTGKTWRAIVDAFSHLLSDADFVSAKLLRGDTKTKPNVVAVTDVLVAESGLEIAALPTGSARVELFLGRVHCFQVVPGSAARWSFARVGKWMANPERAKETGIVVHNV